MTILAIEIPSWVQTEITSKTNYVSTEEKMRLAIRLAECNVKQKTGGPFGAVIFDSIQHTVLGAGANFVLSQKSSLWHAEVVAIFHAQRSIASFSLRNHANPTELYTSVEPCAMCLGAIFWSGVNRIVCAATKSDAESIGFSEGPVFKQSYDYLADHGIKVEHMTTLREDAVKVLRLYSKTGGHIYN